MARQDSGANRWQRQWRVVTFMIICDKCRGASGRLRGSNAGTRAARWSASSAYPRAYEWWACGYQVQNSEGTQVMGNVINSVGMQTSPRSPMVELAVRCNGPGERTKC